MRPRLGAAGLIGVAGGDLSMAERAADPVVAMVSVVLPVVLPAGIMGGLKEQDAPAGRFEQAKVTAAASGPPFVPRLKLKTADWPGAMVTLVGPERTGAKSTPMPLRLNECGLPWALSAMLTVAFREPAAVGLKRTEMEQLLPGASVAGAVGQALVTLKSALSGPMTEMLLMVNGLLPELVSAIEEAALLVPIF